MAFYEYPQMIHEMVEHITEMSLHQLRQIPLDVPIDYSNWWEDMASKNGPFVGPKMFRDFLQPVTILSAIPLSLGGAFLALLAVHSELDIPSMIGFIMLMGIVTKNSILLVEYAIVGIRERGLTRYDALLDACHKRARPIVMTTVAMIAGMSPIALGLGADSSFRQPMAIAVIGGLLTSTALSLLIVPVVYTYIDDLEHWLGRTFRRGAPLQPAPAE